MKQNIFWVRLLLPVLFMAFLASAILLEKKGQAIEARDVMLDILTYDTANIAKAKEPLPGVLILYHAADDFEPKAMQTLADTLDAMRIAYQTVDLSSQALPSLDDVTMLLLCCRSLEPFENDLKQLVTWIEAGGKFGMMMAPEVDSPFRILYRKLGISEIGSGFTEYDSLRYTTGLLPLWGDKVFDSNLRDFALPVRLEQDCTVHMQSAGSAAIPLLWERTVGNGRIAVLNNFLLAGKDSRGFAAQVLFALEDTVIYPIMNAGMVYVDDFPAPQPEGYDKELLKDYGYDIQGMYRNRWWPDMKSLTWEYGLRYTGVLIETYNDIVSPPFEPEKTDGALLKFYASELMQSGGEIGLHGYNHMPLCPPGFPYRDEAYVTWPSMEYMQQGIAELVRYGKKMVPNANFATYVPPSNYLSDEGRAALRRAAPGIRVISGLYLQETGVEALTQEFCEEEDGTISVPRISSGFLTDGYTGFIAAQELMLHGVFSHFIHPDDILDESRGAKSGWDEMFRQFSKTIESIIQTYPKLRFSTSSEGAAAVQRYDRLGIAREETEDGMKVVLSNFYDTAWLALRTRRTPAAIEGGELFKVSDGIYWIRADEAEIAIRWEEGE
jgi:hypothetical protein